MNCLDLNSVGSWAAGVLGLCGTEVANQTNQACQAGTEIDKMQLATQNIKIATRHLITRQPAYWKHQIATLRFTEVLIPSIAE